MKTLGISVLLFLIAAPLWAEDPQWQPATPEQTQVIEQQKAQYPNQPTEGVFQDGRYMGANIEEARAKANAEYNATPHSGWEGTPNEQHDYFDPQTKQFTGLLLVNGHPVSPAEYEADAKAKGHEFRDRLRNSVNDAVREHKQKSPTDQTLEQNALDATIAAQEKLEKDTDESDQKLHEEMTRLVPPRTLRSFEANSSQEK